MTNMNSERVIGIAAEFHKDSRGRLKLFSLFARTEEVSRHDGKTYIGCDGYYVEWSKHWDGYVFHNSSSGFHDPEVRGIYFIWGNIKVKPRACRLVDARARKRNKTRRILRLPKSFNMTDRSNLLEWLQWNGLESDGEWCSECRDYIPTCEEWNTCDHIWWCEKKLGWSTPSERCECKDREECDGE